MEIPIAVEAKLTKAWKYTVMVKVLGKNVGYCSLCERLKAIWKSIKDFKVIDLDHQFFLVQLSNSQEYDNMLYKGPWMVLGHHLVVQQPWYPEFDPEEAQVTRVVAWLRLPGLPIHCYHKKGLRAIGDRIGKLMRVDYNTSNFESGHFARVTVELDLSQPLIPSFEFREKTRKIIYEDLPQVCFRCGLLGYTIQHCEQLKVTNSVAPPIDGGETAMPTTGMDHSNQHDFNGDSVYGEWTLVQKICRFSKAKGRGR